jgi:hypothetical protein
LVDAVWCVVIIDALLQGVKDGMDILTLSLGYHVGWSSTSISVVVDRIAQNGKIVTVAGGNEGEQGSWYSSSPASARHVISVGSVDKSVF